MQILGTWRSKFWAVVSLMLVAALVVLLVGLVYYRPLELLLVGTSSVAGVAVIAASGWWALTTRRRWKRWLHLTVVALVTLVFVLSVLRLAASYGAATLLVPALGLLAAASARLALARAARTTDRPGSLVRHPWLLVNPRSGDGAAARSGLVAAARRQGISVVIMDEGAHPAELARAAAAAGADALGAAGGDGTLAQVAAVAMSADLPFVCIPTGTRNHFARDLGLDPRRPLVALDSFAGVERRVDVGLVQERVFLNNVSLGAYGGLVQQRDYRQGRLRAARSRLPALFRDDACTLEISFEDEAGQRLEGALVLLVSNNAYDLQPPFDLGRRERLDSGVLQVSAVRALSGAGLAAALASAATARVPAAGGWAQWSAPTFRVDGSGALPAAVDGEAATLHPPVFFRAVPGGLRVLVPPGSDLPPLRAIDVLRLRTVRLLWAMARGHP